MFLIARGWWVFGPGMFLFVLVKLAQSDGRWPCATSPRPRERPEWR